MGIDISRLSPAMQRQVAEKLLRANQKSVQPTFESGMSKWSSEGKTAQRGAKYGNAKVEVNGILFDSKKEARRYLELIALEAAGEIRDLQRQVPFELIPSQRIDGKVVEREVKYVADFAYHDKGGSLVVEDTKGMKTRDYIIKRKLMLYVHNIRIREV